jgi:hypothetical protein
MPATPGQQAQLVVPAETANVLLGVLKDTSDEYDVDHVFIHRDGDGAAVGVLMTRETFEGLVSRDG